jgi:hypothetical protein
MLDFVLKFLALELYFASSACAAGLCDEVDLIVATWDVSA